MILSKMWFIIKMRIYHNRKLASYRNFPEYNEENFKYLVVAIHKRKVIKGFRTLKDAMEYLELIGKYYKAKNRDFYLNKNSRSIAISYVAQYIAPDLSIFGGRKMRFSVLRFRAGFRAFPLEKIAKIRKFNAELEKFQKMV